MEMMKTKVLYFVNYAALIEDVKVMEICDFDFMEEKTSKGKFEFKKTSTLFDHYNFKKGIANGVKVSGKVIFEPLQEQSFLEVLQKTYDVNVAFDEELFASLLLEKKHEKFDFYYAIYSIDKVTIDGEVVELNIKNKKSIVAREKTSI